MLAALDTLVTGKHVQVRNSGRLMSLQVIQNRLIDLIETHLLMVRFSIAHRNCRRHAAYRAKRGEKEKYIVYIIKVLRRV